jgi:ribosomal protein S13
VLLELEPTQVLQVMLAQMVQTEIPAMQEMQDRQVLLEITAPLEMLELERTQVLQVMLEQTETQVQQVTTALELLQVHLEIQVVQQIHQMRKLRFYRGLHTQYQ